MAGNQKQQAQNKPSSSVQQLATPQPKNQQAVPQPPTTPSKSGNSHQQKKAKAAWTGFSDKTLWEWLELLAKLAIPIVVTIGTIWFSYQQNIISVQLNNNQFHDNKIIAIEQQQETTLQIYYDRMSDLLLNDKLSESKPGDEVRHVAVSRTLAALQELDSTRKDDLLLFLYSSGLINVQNTIIAMNGADLSNADLSNADLSNADLSNADLRGANLSGVNLSGVNLNTAELSLVNLRGATLNDANLSNTDLSSADLSNAVLKSAILSNANLNHAILPNANLSNDTLISTNLNNATLNNANLSDANLSGANLSGTDLSGANLSGTDLSHADLKNAKITIEQLNESKSDRGAILP